MSTAFASSVAIGPEFFRKAFHDYADRYWAFAREVMQNSIDCGSTHIAVRVHEGDGQTRVEVQNDGEPMDREVLVGKLLSLGSSGKDFRGGAVGGFGKAKEVLYFAHRGYKIISGDWMVEGSGAGYNLARSPLPMRGTYSGVTWQGDVADDLRSAFRKFAGLASWRGTITLDGEELTRRARRTRTLRTLEVDEGDPWARLDRIDAEPGTLVVRAHGSPMFARHVEYKGALAVELLKPGHELLTSNRDGLKWEQRSQLDEVVTHLAVDRRSALKVERAQYTRFAGAKLRAEADEPPTIPVATLVAALAVAESQARPGSGAGIAAEVEGRAEAPASVLAHEFLVKNCTGRRVPPRFDPGSVHFDDHAHWLVRAWAGCLLELHRLADCTDRFSVGFIFSGDCAAEYESTDEYGRVYLLNPAKVGKRKALVRRYSRADRHAIAAIAAHEFVHGGLRQARHDEDYAGKLTDLMGRVLAHWRRFARHFA